MKNIDKFKFLIILFLLSFILSGCYTLIGYAPDAKEMSREGDKDNGYRYRDYDAYYPDPYSLYYYDGYGYSFYGWNWFPSYYWDYPYWDDYYWYTDYYYAPEKKPETRKRDITEFGHSQRLDKWDNRDSKEPKRDNDKQSGKRIEEKRSPRKYRDEE